MKKLHPSVKAIILQDEKFLIIKQSFLDGEIWDLPGGRVEFGDPPYETLFREAREEVNLSVSIIKPLACFGFLDMIVIK